MLQDTRKMHTVLSCAIVPVAAKSATAADVARKLVAEQFAASLSPTMLAAGLMQGIATLFCALCDMLG